MVKLKTLQTWKVGDNMKQVILQSESLNGIMTLTTDFINANILPKYNKIKIKTFINEDTWVSEIYYE